MSDDFNRVLTLQQELETGVGTKLRLKINDNRSTMLSVKWEPDCTRVSLHRMFLRAPANIMEELTCYLRKKERKLSPSISAYIEDNLPNLDYSHSLQTAGLLVNGSHYNLQDLYSKVNHLYFRDPLGLNITWFNRIPSRKANQVVLGLFHTPLKLIKINRLMDTPKVPDFVISYVIYHEMLHHVYPAYVDEKGRRRVHGKIFKEKEREFHYYEQARDWIKDNHHTFFSGVRLRPHA